MVIRIEKIQVLVGEVRTSEVFRSHYLVVLRSEITTRRYFPPRIFFYKMLSSFRRIKFLSIRFVIFPANGIVIDSIRAYVSDEDLNKSYLINMPVNDILRRMRAADDVIDVI